MSGAGRQVGRQAGRHAGRQAGSRCCRCRDSCPHLDLQVDAPQRVLRPPPLPRHHLRQLGAELGHRVVARLDVREHALQLAGGLQGGEGGEGGGPRTEAVRRRGSRRVIKRAVELQHAAIDVAADEHHKDPPAPFIKTAYFMEVEDQLRDPKGMGPQGQLS